MSSQEANSTGSVDAGAATAASTITVGELQIMSKGYARFLSTSRDWRCVVCESMRGHCTCHIVYNNYYSVVNPHTMIS